MSDAFPEEPARWRKDMIPSITVCAWLYRLCGCHMRHSSEELIAVERFLDGLIIHENVAEIVPYAL